MFVFLIPRTPVIYRNPLRDELWTICKKALQSQTSTNWKALIIGDVAEDQLDPKHFLSIDMDNYDKIQKLESALSLVETWEIKPDYIIRLDDDDIISPFILSFIEKQHAKQDCYYDSRHACIDLVYLKVSYLKNDWFPNTIIHKYEHAVARCGEKNQKLILQNHDEYWHTFYSNRQSFGVPANNAIYYRILSPFSITSALSSSEKNIKWSQHLSYLNGYGPWIALSESFSYYDQLKKISRSYFQNKPNRKTKYWLFNRFKYFKNKLLNR